MKPGPFSYHRAETFEHAVELLTELGQDARPIAGGQSLVPMMNFRLARPNALVDITKIPGYRFVVRSDAGIEIGGLATHTQLEHQPAFTGALSVFAETARVIGHPAIRNVGTVGGSLAHADPAAEWSTLLTALGAEIEIIGPKGRRAESMADFVRGPFTTSLEHGELVRSVRLRHIPKHIGFVEFARRAGDFAVAMAAVAFDQVEGGTITEPKVVIGGIGAGPLVIGDAARRLEGSPASEQVCEDAGLAAAEAADADGGSTGYIRHLIRTLVKRACLSAATRETQTGGA